MTQEHRRAAVRPSFLNEKAPRGALVVGMTGFEPAAPWSQTRRSTKLSHIPQGIKKVVGMTGLEPAASWSLTRRSTKLSYIPTQPLKGKRYYTIRHIGCQL